MSFGGASPRFHSETPSPLAGEGISWFPDENYLGSFFSIWAKDNIQLLGDVIPVFYLRASPPKEESALLKLSDELGTDRVALDQPEVFAGQRAMAFLVDGEADGSVRPG